MEINVETVLGKIPKFRAEIDLDKSLTAFDKNVETDDKGVSRVVGLPNIDSTLQLSIRPVGSASYFIVKPDTVEIETSAGVFKKL